MSENITIDPSVLENRSETYSSLTDTNGVDVFTDKYGEQVEAYRQQQEEQYHALGEDIFIEEMQYVKSRETEVRDRLFLNTATQLQQSSQKESAAGDRLLFPGIGILVILMAAWMLHYFKKRKGRWKKDVADTYSYE